MDVREAIYQNFSRAVGNPYQTKIFNQSQLSHFITLNSGQNDNCFASNCFYQGNTPIFDTVFLETDTLNLSPIIAVSLWYQAHAIPFITAFSGNRGFHIRALFEPEIVSPITLKKFSEIVLKETNNQGNFDAHVIGDLRRLARIPNTRRLNGLWCIPLLQEYIQKNPPIPEIISLAKTPQFISYHEKIKKPRITEFVKDVMAEEYHHPQERKTTPTTSNFFLHDVLRPCVHKKLCSPNPNHIIRISATIEMLNHGLKENQIVDAFSSLNWIDFDRTYTHYQIQTIEEKWKQGIAHPTGKAKVGCSKKISCLQCVLSG